MARFPLPTFMFALSMTVAACREGGTTLLTEAGDADNESSASSDDDESEDVVRESNWSDETHSNDVEPDFAVVFPDDQLLRFEITIDTAQWDAMQDDLDDNLTTTMGGPGMGPMGGSDTDFTPMWGEATIAFNGNAWQHVGIRYKGNSTLRVAYQSGTDKFPFKLDFDEWEETYPEIDDQRFHGFKQLNLGSNANDESFMREKLASDLFREFGVVSAHVAFCEVYLDRGNGMNFVGLYSLVEEVDDTVIETQFPDGGGNLYKPEGTGATFASGSYNEEELYLKTNEDVADYSDALSFYEALHDDSRQTDEVTWTSNLEAAFDVDAFLRYLAVNQVIQNWDTYGVMTHNYFIYNDEGLLTWIPWDNNESLQEGRMGTLSLGLDEVSDEWPILRFVMDVPSYEATYRQYVQEFSDDYFTEDRVAALLDSHTAVIGEVANQESPNFTSAVSAIQDHVVSRQADVANFLN